MAQNGIGLVYGGGNTGLMGIIANSALAHHGEAIGVIPNKLKERERAHLGLSELHVVETMHERKALLDQLSDAIITMPGGIGTLDEFCEIMTWNQLGYINKPMGVFNVNGYYNNFLEMLDDFVREGFYQQPQRDRLIVEEDEGLLLERIIADSAMRLSIAGDVII